jgi:hypothetical protein
MGSVEAIGVVSYVFVFRKSWIPLRISERAVSRPILAPGHTRGL